MTIEELASLVRDGNTTAYEELWEKVRRFVAMQAKKYFMRFYEPSFELQELENAGFFALLEACNHFNPERAGFLTCLDLYAAQIVLHGVYLLCCGCPSLRAVEAPLCLL